MTLWIMQCSLIHTRPFRANNSQNNQISYWLSFQAFFFLYLRPLSNLTVQEFPFSKNIAIVVQHQNCPSLGIKLVHSSKHNNKEHILDSTFKKIQILSHLYFDHVINKIIDNNIVTFCVHSTEQTKLPHKLLKQQHANIQVFTLEISRSKLQKMDADLKCNIQVTWYNITVLYQYNDLIHTKNWT